MNKIKTRRSPVTDIYEGKLSLKKIKKEIRPDLKICWFAVTRPVLQETCGSKKSFDAHS